MNQQTQSNVRSDENESNMAKSAVQEKAAPVKEKAREVVDETKSKMEQAGNRAKSVVAEQKDQAANQLHGFAQVLRQTGDQLRERDQKAFASYSNQAADQIDRMSGYLQERDMNDLIRDAEDFARRQPELFIGGAFTLGLLVARFLKSSAPEPRRDYSMNRPSPRSTTLPTTRIQKRTARPVGQRPYSPGD